MIWASSLNQLYPQLVGLGLTLSVSGGVAQWPAWRGPEGTGVYTGQALPLKWNSHLNVRWRTPLPEPGNSSPIIWGDRAFLTQAVQAEHRRTLMCFDRTTGKLLWQSGITYRQAEPTQENNPYWLDEVQLREAGSLFARPLLPHPGPLPLGEGAPLGSRRKPVRFAPTRCRH